MAGIQYYKIVGRGRSSDDPSGVARRIISDAGVIDESLTRYMTWQFTSSIMESEHGEELSRDLIAISSEEAQELIERFREKWAGAKE
jgi:hypothetical protein